MEKINKINTIIVGGGQSGLSASYFLKKERIDHIILEKADKPAFAWREQRWDSFTFVTPSNMISLPGVSYEDFNFHPDDDGSSSIRWTPGFYPWIIRRAGSGLRGFSAC